MSKSKSNYYVYFLRRPDKEDEFEPGNWQPFYVGRGNNRRINIHRREANNLFINPDIFNSNPIRNYIIHKLWSNNLDFIEEKVLVGLTNDEANYYEMEAIAAYGRINNGTGCLSNMTDGGDGCCGMICSKEHRLKISAANKGKKRSEEYKQSVSDRFKGVSHLGYPHSEESKQKIREAHIGIGHTEEIKMKLSILKKEWWESLTEQEKNEIRERLSKGSQKYLNKLKQEGKDHHNKNRIPSEETRKKISKATAGENNPNYGKPMSEEQKRKISVANTGKVRTEEFKQDVSKRTTGENNPNYGNYWTDEQKKHMSEIQTGKTHTEEAKKKISIANTGRKHTEEELLKMSKAQKGRPKSEEHRRKLSAANKGKSRDPFSEEHRQKLSESGKRRMSDPNNHPMKNKKHKIETKQKLSEAKLGDKNPNFGKPLSEEHRQKLSESHKLRNKLRRWDKLISEFINQYIPEEA